MALVARPVLARPLFERRAPAARPRPRAETCSPNTRVEHHIEQLGLAGNIRVERHRADFQPLGHAPHRQRRQALGVGDLDGRTHDLIHADAWLGAAGRAPLHAPEQLHAALRVASATVLGRHLSAPSALRSSAYSITQYKPSICSPAAARCLMILCCSFFARGAKNEQH